jgi:TRAP-type C4-dicarboxylate transport system permease small subunit
METFLKAVGAASRHLNMVAGVSITFMMLLTVADVILRSFRMPILGTYELVAFSGAMVVGFSLPFTSWAMGHIYVDSFVGKLPRRLKNAFNIGTRCLGVGLFFLIGWNLLRMGLDLYRSGEVSLTLKVPFYPVVLGVGLSCFLQCLVLISQIVKIAEGKYE